MADKTNEPAEAFKTLVITRTFDAPREMVFKMWTDPKLMAMWWGPKPFTAPVIKMDLRVGGEYLFCMRSPEGKDYWSGGIYKEINPPERLVYTDHFADENGKKIPASDYGFDGYWPDEFVVTVTFEQQANKTKMTLKHEGFPAGAHGDMAKEGWTSSLDKLEEYLAKVQA